MAIYTVNGLSLSKIGDLLREQLGEDVAEYTFPSDFEKAVADIGFKGFVFSGDAPPYDLIVIGNFIPTNFAYSSSFVSGNWGYAVRSVRFIADSVIITQNGFRGLWLLETVDFQHVSSIAQEAFRQCSALREINAPDCVSIQQMAFHTCTALTTVLLPKMQMFNANTFQACTGLTDVEIGSVDYPVTSLINTTFNGCTQSGLTVTAYALSNYVDTLVSNIRNGATNATIIIKASENTTYNNVSYNAGDTILTSEVTS